MSDPTPVTGTSDIDWLRSVTTTEIERTKSTSHSTITHTAMFAIEPGTATDLLPHSTAKRKIRPTFLTVAWKDGRRTQITVSGRVVLKSGELGRSTDRRYFWYREGTPPPADVPEPIAAAITTYETAVTTLAGKS